MTHFLYDFVDFEHFEALDSSKSNFGKVSTLELSYNLQKLNELIYQYPYCSYTDPIKAANFLRFFHSFPTKYSRKR